MWLRSIYGEENDSFYLNFKRKMLQVSFELLQHSDIDSLHYLCLVCKSLYKTCDYYFWVEKFNHHSLPMIKQCQLVGEWIKEFKLLMDIKNTIHELLIVNDIERNSRYEPSEGYICPFYVDDYRGIPPLPNNVFDMMRKIMVKYDIVDRWDLTSIWFTLTGKYELQYQIVIPDENYHPNHDTIGSVVVTMEEIKEVLIKYLYYKPINNVDITDGNGHTFLLDYIIDYDDPILSKRLGIIETLRYPLY